MRRVDTGPRSSLTAAQLGQAGPAECSEQSYHAIRAAARQQLRPERPPRTTYLRQLCWPAKGALAPSAVLPSRRLLDGLKPRGGLLYVTSEVYLPIRVPDPDHATPPPTLRKLLTRVHAQSKGGARVNPVGPDATWLLMGSIQLLGAARSGRLERYLVLASFSLERSGSDVWLP